MANPIEFFQDFLKNIRNVGLEYYHRYYAFYPGIVVDNKDPEKRGRVKVELPTLLGIKKQHTRWVTPLNSSLGQKNSGHLDVPYLNQVVSVGFFHGSLNEPFYIGGSFAKDETPEAFKTNYPNVRGWVFSSGQKILIDETKDKQSITLINTDGTKVVFSGDKGKETFSIVHKEGSKIVLNEKGDVLISDKNEKETINVKSGQIDINSNGKVNVTSNGDISVVAKGKLEGTGSDVSISAKQKAEVKGTSGSDFGSAAGPTNVKGSIVTIGDGVMPAARLGSMGIGVGNMGGPVMVTIIDGSPKVLIP